MPGRAIVRQVVSFGRVLREAGLEVGPGRVADALAGLDAVDVRRRDDVYWTLRASLVSRHEEIEIFDRAFEAWFQRQRIMADRPPKTNVPQRMPGMQKTSAADADGAAADGDARKGWSVEEILRRKDFGQLTDDEFAALRRLIAETAACRPQRRSRRLRRHSRGRVLDLRRLARGSLATGGDPIERAFRRRIDVPRKVVLICDVSGSMEAYARAVLLFVHGVLGTGRGVEAFAFGTRLTRLTPELSARDPDEALSAAAKRVADWSGGTQIGVSLKAFNDEWGRRALTRGAVVVVVSDGWERGEAGLVGREMARLRRQAYALVWVNPLKGNPDYQPLAGGMRAALPHVDRFLPGHNLASLEGLAEVLAGIERRHAA